MEQTGTEINVAVGLIAIVALVLLNGFFVAAEFALVSVRKTRIEELVTQGVKSAEIVRKAIRHPDQFIAATQLGITLASLGLGWAGEPALSHLLDPVIALIPLPVVWGETASHTLAAAISFAIITFMHVVIGELAPKSIALQRPEQTALVVARPTMWAEVLFRPGIWLLNGAGNLLLRTLGFRGAAGHDMVHSVEEIRMLVEHSTTHGLLEESEHEMVDAVFDLRDLTLRQVMVPRTEMAMIPLNSTLRDFLLMQKETPYTKIPVYGEDSDHILGILHLRDTVSALAAGDLDKPIRPFMGHAIFLPENTRISGALAAFREGRQHMAIVLDEFGGTAGLVTLEDILEEISGDIPDQYDRIDSEITRRPDGSWTISGLAQLESVNEALKLHLSDDNYDTIGGYVMGKLERIPAAGDEITVEGLHFRVEQVDGRRIDQLAVRMNEGNS